MPVTYDPVQTNTLATATPSITFSSISQDYTDLVLVIAGIESANQYVGIRFNGDSTAVYSQNRLAGQSGAPFADRQSGATFGRLSVGNPSKRFNCVCNIPDYTNSTRSKAWLSRFNIADSSDPMVGIICGRWTATPAPITSITITTSTADNFNVGTSFTLYGIKAA